MLLSIPATAQDRQTVTASDPEALAVTVYRDPYRDAGENMDIDWPQGFAMISETRTVTLPPGRSTIRFDGVAEGMVAVSAIVTGLPGGTIEKNRNADLLSPAALVDGSLGNRIFVTRTNPATGAEETQPGIVRTRADGGLVLQTGEGYEAVRCAGLPERLTFEGVPEGLSAEPVFTIDTMSEAGGTWTVTLTYLAWGFDWQANYVATIHEGRDSDDIRFDLTSWLTILNDNGQSFEGAELLAVAGTLNVVSDFETLGEAPYAEPLYLTCYPIGSTAAGTPLYNRDRIVVTGSRSNRREFETASPIAVVSEEMVMSMADGDMPGALPQVLAGEEALGDLKLYRMPVPVDVNAQGLKQVAFLQQRDVEGELVYEFACSPWNDREEFLAASMLLETVNDEEHGLGMAMPSGAVSVFERGALGEFLVAEDNLRDYAQGQDVELQLGSSAQVFGQCRLTGGSGGRGTMRAVLSNANPAPVRVRLLLGSPAQYRFRGVRGELRNGMRIVEISVPANGTRSLEWQVQPVYE